MWIDVWVIRKKYMKYTEDLQITNVVKLQLDLPLSFAGYSTGCKAYLSIAELIGVSLIPQLQKPTCEWLALRGPN